MHYTNRDKRKYIINGCSLGHFYKKKILTNISCSLEHAFIKKNFSQMEAALWDTLL